MSVGSTSWKRTWVVGRGTDGGVPMSSSGLLASDHATCVETNQDRTQINVQR